MMGAGSLMSRLFALESPSSDPFGADGLDIDFACTLFST
jgi:hypothetical protein